MAYFRVLSPEVKSKLIEYFADKSVGTTLNCGDLVSLDSGQKYALENDYIKLEKDIYALAAGKGAVLGEGSFGKVIYTRSLSSDTLLVMKIIPFSPSDRTFEELGNELVVLHDLGLYRDAATLNRDGDSKQYIAMINAGVSLDNYIRLHPSLTAEARLDLAIKLCWLVHQLHRGLSSRGLTAYAHRDLKPANVAFSPSGTMRLIDVGLTTHELDSLPAAFAGAPIYLPNIKTFLNVKVNLRELDILALKRIIYMPNQLFCFVGYKEDQDKRPFGVQMLLSQQVLKHYKVFELFDTSARGSKQGFVEQQQFDGEPLILASLLVLARYGLMDFFGAKMSNPTLAAAVLGMHFANEGSANALVTKQIKDVLTAYILCRVAVRHQGLAEQVRLMALFVSLGLTNNLHAALASKVFVNLIKTAPSPIILHAAASLWQHGFCNDRLLMQLTNDQIATKVINLLFDGDFAHVERLLTPLAKERAKTTARRLSFPSIFVPPTAAQAATKGALSERVASSAKVTAPKSLANDRLLELPSVFFPAPKATKCVGGQHRIAMPQEAFGVLY